MNHLKRLLFSCLLFACISPMIQAQQLSTIPTDPNVRVGKLSNGLTYYIRHNALPEKRAYFYIAQKVGAIQEEPQQRGLAHFLEHMCFNGTKHFPGSSLIQCLERYGVKFGENLNAYTSIDETVYNIDNVPTTNPAALDSCLLILHDWSNDLLLDPTEIDKERGVINEEWRSRNSANQRVMETLMPAMMAGSKYADSMPIGSMDVVMHFKPQVLRDYYEKWYRPDLQAVVIVGDINVDEIEAKIKSVFADIPAQPNAATREYYPVPDNTDPIVKVSTDKELTQTSATFYFKHNAFPDSLKSNMQYLVVDYINDMIGSMLNERYKEIMHQSNPPFTGASVGNGDFFVAKTKEAFTAMVGCKENDIEGSIKAMLRELYRAKEFGFTQSEYDRKRVDFLRGLESAYNERDKQKSKEFINDYVRNFLDKEPIPSTEQEYNIYNAIAPKIPLSAINKVMAGYITDNNRVITLIAPEKADLKVPTESQLLKWMDEVKAEKLTAYVDKTTNEPLMSTKPKAGRIVTSKVNAAEGTKEFTLSNGAKVIIMKTDFKKDQINMRAMSRGGSSLLPENDLIDVKNLSVASLGGVGKFSNLDLQKVLTGKMASAAASISLNTESVNASCSPKDLETMMQLVYLTFTSPRKDIEAFNSFKIRLKAALKNQALQPMTALRDTINKALYKDQLRGTMRITEDMVDKINYDKILSMYKNRFKDASDFTFFFVGNIDEAQLKPMLERYIASLPATHQKENWKNMLYTRRGVYTNEFVKEEKVPKSTILMIYSGDAKLSLRNNIIADILGQILDMVYTKTIREDAGAAYSVQCDCNIDMYPNEQAMLEIQFPTAPEKKEMAIKLTKEGLENLIKNGPDKSYFDKVVEFKLKKHAENIKENSYWMSILMQRWMMGIDFNKDYNQILKSITPADIQKFAADLYKQKNVITVSMTSPAK